MFALSHERCTQALDLLIADQRVCYASERVDFHDYFKSETVAQIQAVLRGREGPRRMIFVGLLLKAQKKSPHSLWTMLLVQAFESTLIARRRALGAPGDPARDELVLGAFLEAVEHIPACFEGAEVREYVLETSQVALDEALRDERHESLPPAAASGVRLVA